MEENTVFAMPEIAYSPYLTLERIGLHNGRIRGEEVFHNAGWYVLGKEQGSCPKIGWGDLSIPDIQNIENSLGEGEALLILLEEDSFWNFVTENPGLVGSFCKTSPTEKDPGICYIAERLAGVVVKGAFFRVQSNYSEHKTGEKYIVKMRGNGGFLEVTALEEKDVKKLLNIS